MSFRDAFSPALGPATCRGAAVALALFAGCVAAEDRRAIAERERAAAEKNLAEAQAAEQARREAQGPLIPPVLRHDAGVQGDRLLQEALALEAQGKYADAVRAYTRAARNRSGKAAMRLGEIYAAGWGEIARDVTESKKWYRVARVLGEDVPPEKHR